MCIYLCSHIIGYNEKENRREADRRHTHHLIGVVVSNLTRHVNLGSRGSPAKGYI